MSKKTKKGKTQVAAADRRPAGRVRLISMLALTCALLTAAYSATRYDAVRLAVGLRPLPAAAIDLHQGGPPLAKEYVYAGGRLIATEEPTPAPTPTPTPSGSPPSVLVATASFPSQTATAVKLTWSAPPPGPTPTAYVVERASVRVSDGVKTDYAQLGQPVTQLPTQTAPYFDPAPEQGMVYAYRVRAVYAGGYSDYSNRDVATTFRYTGDDPLVGAGDPQHPPSTVSAAQLTELRQVIQAVRALAGSGPATWKQNPAPEGRGRVLADHFTELRQQLNPALEALGINPMPPDPNIASTKPVKKEGVQDVREKIR